MRSTISLGVASLAALWASSAFAFTSTGILESVTPSQNQVRLQNGDAYRLPSEVDLSGYRAGQRVHVSWDRQNPSVLSVGGDQDVRLLDAMNIRSAD
jgi:hypothetical protein